MLSQVADMEILAMEEGFQALMEPELKFERSEGSITF